jgi:hypothetical protein
MKGEALRRVVVACTEHVIALRVAATDRTLFGNVRLLVRNVHAVLSQAAVPGIVLRLSL